MPSLRLTHSRVYKAEITTSESLVHCIALEVVEDSCTIFLGTRRLAFELLPPGPFGSTLARAFLGEIVSIRSGLVVASHG